MKLSRYGLAVEGWIFVLSLGAATAWLVISPMPVFAILPAVLLMLALLKFRDPPRNVRADPMGVISPVDGVLERVARDDDSWHLRIRIAPFTPYLFRSPTEGKVLESGHERGQHGIRIRTDEDDEVFLRLYGFDWLPPASTLDYGERVGQGQRYGLLRSAHTAELWLPADAEILVRRGDKVMAGESVLARFYRNGVPGNRAPANGAPERSA